MSMENINREHPEYVARKAMWRQYKDLYAGGEQLRASAAEYLVRRHKEPGEVYQERLNRVFYQNYIGSIIDWYSATLMRREPVLLFEGRALSLPRFGARMLPAELRDTQSHAEIVLHFLRERQQVSL